MDTAARARAAARETVADIEPPALRAVLLDRLETTSMAPGVLVLVSATGRDSSVAIEPLLDRAVGVQLIYEGLRLTRSLAHEEPWTDVDDTEIDADLDILAADVLVSRGFSLLATTEAFGGGRRDRTGLRPRSDDSPPDRD
ncbi:MAG: hypothetical protein J07HN6_00104 [Halonotius sp. J07HN6]|nr:MAG: hypothetical protein J07HN6_00104 [Halonotius sp. J07HN6]